MKRRTRLLAALATAAWACNGDPTASESPDAPWVAIRGTRVSVELARSDAEQIQGLSDREELPWGRGMLFQYPEARPLAFWMLRMHFPIDMVWLRDGRLIAISHRVPPPPPGTARSALQRYGPGELADSVLEVPAGFAEAHGWRPGDRVELSAAARLRKGAPAR